MQRLSLPVLIAAGFCLLGVSGCRPPPPKVDRLAMAVQQALAMREGKLSRFMFGAKLDQRDQPLTSFDFTFRAPGRMRGRFYRPRQETLSFDGTSVFQVLPDQKVFRKLALPPSPEARGLRLTQRFAPFIPEGFRMPDLPWNSVHATPVSHPRAPEAVALSVDLPPENGKPHLLTYTVRWPSGDFLVRREESADGVVETRVEDENCDQKAGFCTPLKMSTFKNSVKTQSLEILELEMNESPAVEEFTLTPPAGYTVENAAL